MLLATRMATSALLRVCANYRWTLVTAIVVGIMFWTSLGLREQVPLPVYWLIRGAVFGICTAQMAPSGIGTKYMPQETAMTLMAGVAFQASLWLPGAFLVGLEPSPFLSAGEAVVSILLIAGLLPLVPMAMNRGKLECRRGTMMHFLKRRFLSSCIAVFGAVLAVGITGALIRHFAEGKGEEFGVALSFGVQFVFLASLSWEAVGSSSVPCGTRPLIDSSAASDSDEEDQTDGDGAHDESPTENK